MSVNLTDDEVFEREYKWLPIVLLWIVGGCLGSLRPVIFKITGIVLLMMSIVFGLLRYRIAGSLYSVINRFIKWHEEQRKKYDF